MEAKLNFLKFVKDFPEVPKYAINSLMAFSVAHWLSHIAAQNQIRTLPPK